MLSLSNLGDCNSHFCTDSVFLGPGTDPLNVYVVDLPLTMTKEQFSQIYEPFGNLVSCTILNDPNTQVSRGIGFARYSNTESAARAVKETQGLVLEGSSKPIVVRFARDTTSKRQHFHHQHQLQHQHSHNPHPRHHNLQQQQHLQQQEEQLRFLAQQGMIGSPFPFPNAPVPTADGSRPFYGNIAHGAAPFYPYSFPIQSQFPIQYAPYGLTPSPTMIQNSANGSNAEMIPEGLTNPPPAIPNMPLDMTDPLSQWYSQYFAQLAMHPNIANNPPVSVPFPAPAAMPSSSTGHSIPTPTLPSPFRVTTNPTNQLVEKFSSLQLQSTGRIQ